MTREEAVALLERYSNYDGMGIPNLAGCKEAMKVAVDALKEAFPELAESEDERIRRWLCDYFSSIDKAWIHKDITCIDILRWLEKQKEQKKEKFPPYVTGFKGHPDPAGTSDLEEAAARYERDNRESILSSVDIVEAFIAGAEWQKEQKPAEWNDTKELVFKDICNHLEAEGYSGWVLLLSALRNGEFQTKQEWSEEDEKMLQSIIKDFRAGKVSTIGQEQWLKSLRPSWKPNDEDEVSKK